MGALTPRSHELTEFPGSEDDASRDGDTDSAQTQFPLLLNRIRYGLAA